jgi:hypothetical protein
VILQSIDKDIDTQIKAKELEKKYVEEEYRQLVRLEEEH